MKNLYKAKFRIAQDDNGETGIIPLNCPSFNASWSTLMLFHDVFEHWFEHEHKYFKGYAAENIGGEICAMGALWYLYEEFGITYRLNARNDARDSVIDSILYFFSEDNYTYGSELVSHVPKQPKSESEELEYIINETFTQIKALNGQYSMNPEAFKDTQNSATFRKIADLYRYGYNMAERMFPAGAHNCSFFFEFWDYWTEFFKLNSDPEPYIYCNLQINIAKIKGQLSWQAYFEGHRLPKDYPPYLDEILTTEAAQY